MTTKPDGIYRSPGEITIQQPPVFTHLPEEYEKDWKGRLCDLPIGESFYIIKHIVRSDLKRRLYLYDNTKGFGDTNEDRIKVTRTAWRTVELDFLGKSPGKIQVLRIGFWDKILFATFKVKSFKNIDLEKK